MEEKIIIKGEFSKNNILVISCYLLAAVLLLISIWLYSFDTSVIDDGYLFTAIALCYPEGIGVLFYASVLVLCIGTFLSIMMNSCEITVTDKRVYGKTKFGRQIDLPLDKISSVGTCMLSGLKVATSSGLMEFWLLTNREDVYTSISELLQSRQNSVPEKSVYHASSADELGKYKDLLDKGIITQEEFDAKKKQLLGL